MIPSEKRNEDLLNEKAETSLSSEQWALLTSAVIVRQWANQQTRRLVGMGYHGNKSFRGVLKWSPALPLATRNGKNRYNNNQIPRYYWNKF